MGGEKSSTREKWECVNGQKWELTATRLNNKIKQIKHAI